MLVFVAWKFEKWWGEFNDEMFPNPLMKKTNRYVASCSRHYARTFTRSIQDSDTFFALSLRNSWSKPAN
jgi:hypothetical protein